MNSSRWRAVRAAQLQAHPFCELCEQQGRLTEARVVHHLVEVESANNDWDAWRLATSMTNLQSLCFQCHHDVHARKGYHSPAAHQERNQDRLNQWIARQTDATNALGLTADE